MTSPLNILMIEDNPDDQQFFRDLFSESSLGQFNLHLTDRLKDGKEYLRKHAIDVLLLDLSLPDSFELEGFIEIKEEFPHLPVIILTGMSDFKMAVKAIQFGAQDYLEKWRYDDYLMAKSIRYALERQKLLLEREKVSNQLMNSLKMLDVVNVELKELNEQLEEKVRKRTNDLLKEKQKVEKQHQLITESLQYASTIQHAILPHQQVIMRNIPESFILFKPKDIVSGDFYWAAKTNGKIIIAAVDCTGHGVPGAMLSMLGYTQLNQIVRENGITNPPDILTRLHDNMQNLLNQKFMHSGSSDGMDISLCCIDQKENRVSYAGAMRPLFRYRNGELSIFSGNRMPIGGKYRNGTQYFQGDEFLYERGDTIYLFTDGYIDQFGGNEGKKFKSRNFKTLLKTIHQLPAEQQLEALEKQFNTWKGNEEQVDDILVIGLRM